MGREFRLAACVVAIAVLSGCGDAESSSDSLPIGGTGGVPAQPIGGTAETAMPEGGMSALPTGGSAGTVAPMDSGTGGMISAGSGGMSGAGSGGGGSGGTPPIEPDAGTAMMPCDRACLTALNTAYLEALITNDASSLPLAPDVRFTENGAELSLTEGLWAVAASLSGYRQDFAEPATGQTASFVKLEDDAGDVLLAARLAVVEGRITEIETIVARRGEATFFSPNNLTTADPIYDAALDAPLRRSREQMIATVDLYFDGLEAGDGSMVPFDSGATRTENGVMTASGSSIANLSAFSYIDQIKRRYVLVDEERGVVLPFALFEIPNGLTGSRTLHIAELFKVSADQIMKIDAIMVNMPLGTGSGWE